MAPMKQDANKQKRAFQFQPLMFQSISSQLKEK